MANPAKELTETLRTVVESERQEKIAALAFEFWLARAFRNGSPETDWLRAHHEVRRKWERLQEGKQPRNRFLVQPRTSQPSMV